MNKTIPLKKRPWDYGFLAFFFINLFFITYIVDLEQLVIADPSNFEYPVWPLPFLVDMVHWWGNNFDPVLMARPPWWKATIWLDAVFFGPFYAFAIYAFIKGKNWIRIPALLQSAVLFTNVFIILSEELFGPYATPAPGLVILANAPWFIVPVLMVIRMRRTNPFTENG